MATAKKVTKLLVICRHCDLPQRVPTTPEGKNSEVWGTQLSSKRPLEPSLSPNELAQFKFKKSIQQVKIMGMVTATLFRILFLQNLHPSVNESHKSILVPRIAHFTAGKTG